MEQIKRVRKTDLARHTRQVIREVQRGQTAIVESHGQPEAAILDIVDYHLLRAVMRYYAHQSDIQVEAGLSDQAVAALTDRQSRYDLVLAHYLAGAVSLARAAELLDLPWLDLRARCLRLEIPLHTAPVDLEQARADVKTATAWTKTAEQ